MKDLVCKSIELNMFAIYNIHVLYIHLEQNWSCFQATCRKHVFYITPFWQEIVDPCFQVSFCRIFTLAETNMSP